MWIRLSGAAAGARVVLLDRVASLVLAALVFVATVIVELTTLPFLPATADVIPHPVTAYVANQFSDTVTPIDVATNTHGTPIPVGHQPFAVAITPNGKTVYVTTAGDGRVTPIDVVKPLSCTTMRTASMPS